MTVREMEGWSTRTQEMASRLGSSWVFGLPYQALSAPTANRQDPCPRAPYIREGRRPQVSRKRMAGKVRTTLRMYWIDAVSSGSSIPADCIR